MNRVLILELTEIDADFSLNSPPEYKNGGEERVWIQEQNLSVEIKRHTLEKVVM